MIKKDVFKLDFFFSKKRYQIYKVTNNYIEYLLMNGNEGQVQSIVLECISVDCIAVNTQALEPNCLDFSLSNIEVIERK